LGWAATSAKQDSVTCTTPTYQTGVSPSAVLLYRLTTCTADLEEYYRAKDPKPLLFCHFANGRGGSEYGEVCDAASWKRLQRTLNEGLMEYNETNAGACSLLCGCSMCAWWEPGAMHGTQHAAALVYQHQRCGLFPNAWQPGQDVA
jgi:hypothetical protein